MEIKAKLRHLRISPRKVRLIADLIRGMDAGQAQTQLRLLTKRSASPVLKLLNSAIANAKNNFGITDENNLFIKEIRVDQGPALKRWRARAMGRAGAIRKRTSHISLILEEKVASQITIKKKTATINKETLPEIQSMPEKILPKDEKKPLLPDTKRKREEFSKQSFARKFSRLGNKIFRRKSI